MNRHSVLNVNVLSAVEAWETLEVVFAPRLALERVAEELTGRWIPRS